MKGPGGYGRYDDDPNHVGCPRAKSDMTPCVARDGCSAETDNGACVGCGECPANLLTALVRLVTEPAATDADADAPSAAGAPVAAGAPTDPGPFVGPAYMVVRRWEP